MRGYTPTVQIPGLRRAENDLQIALQGLLGQLTGYFGDDHTTTVEKVGLRYTGESIVDSGGAGIVYNVEVGDPIGAQEVQPLSVIILEIDSEKDNPLALCVLPC